MLGNTDAVANVAVKNLDTAKKFYKDTVGLTPVAAEGDEVVVFKSGSSKLNVYRSQTPARTRRPPFHGTSATGWMTSCAT